jgi:hypothetical protein
MTKLNYLERRHTLIPEFQEKWDKRKGVTAEDLENFKIGNYSDIFDSYYNSNWRGLTAELQAADDAMLSSYSWILLLVAAIVVFYFIFGRR